MSIYGQVGGGVSSEGKVNVPDIKQLSNDERQQVLLQTQGRKDTILSEFKSLNTAKQENQDFSAEDEERRRLLESRLRKSIFVVQLLEHYEDTVSSIDFQYPGSILSKVHKKNEEIPSQFDAGQVMKGSPRSESRSIKQNEPLIFRDNSTGKVIETTSITSIRKVHDGRFIIETGSAWYTLDFDRDAISKEEEEKRWQEKNNKMLEYANGALQVGDALFTNSGTKIVILDISKGSNIKVKMIKVDGREIEKTKKLSDITNAISDGQIARITIVK